MNAPRTPLLILLVASGCSGTAPAPAVDPAATAGAPALRAPAGEPALPADHPPVAAPPAGSTSRPGGTISWQKPSSWVEERPSSSMRRAQYAIEGAAGRAECVVFYFGPGQGGDAPSNVERWAGQFRGPDGGPVSPETRELALEAGTALLVEIKGSYDGGGPMGGTTAEPRPGSMLLGAIVPGPDANWFFKLTGPEATVIAARADFEAMIASVRAGSVGSAPEPA